MDVRTGAHDVGTHGVEEVGQIHDVGLLGGVFDDGGPSASTAAIMMFIVAPTDTTSR